ncbi:unnamed protein product, partial [Ectocarpus sp. 12 AP-2014]
GCRSEPCGAVYVEEEYYAACVVGSDNVSEQQYSACRGGAEWQLGPIPEGLQHVREPHRPKLVPRRAVGPSPNSVPRKNHPRGDSGYTRVRPTRAHLLRTGCGECDGCHVARPGRGISACRR